jgi:hypothetical protein
MKSADGPKLWELAKDAQKLLTEGTVILDRLNNFVIRAIIHIILTQILNGHNNQVIQSIMLQRKTKKIYSCILKARVELLSTAQKMNHLSWQVKKIRSINALMVVIKSFLPKKKIKIKSHRQALKSWKN